MPVWIATIGILFFYDTFILAQCTSVMKRFKLYIQSVDKAVSQVHKAEKSTVNTKDSVLSQLWQDMRCSGHRNKIMLLAMSAFTLTDSFSISFLGAGMSIDLIGAVLYSIDSIRDFLGMDAKQRRAEPWAVLTFLS